MPRDPIRAERDDDVGAFIAKDRRDAFDELIERDVGQPVIGVAQPFVAIGAPAQGDPRPAILLFPDRAERLARGERRIGDHAGLTARGMDEDEPERRILRVQRDGSRHTERVVVGMGEDRGEPRAHPCPSRASNPTREARTRSDGLHRHHDPRHERRPVGGVVTDRERLPLAAQDDLLMRHRSREPHRVDADALDVAAACAAHPLDAGLVVGARATCRRHPPRGGHGGSRRRVRLVLVMELDDLGIGQVPDRLFGEALHQHGADREVGSDEHADVALLRPHGIGIEPRGAGDDVDPVLDAPGDVRGSDGRAGELDGHVGRGGGERIQRVRDRDALDTCCPACDGSTAAASSRSGSAVTARATSRPIRPAAPTTPTRITP